MNNLLLVVKMRIQNDRGYCQQITFVRKSRFLYSKLVLTFHFDSCQKEEMTYYKLTNIF